jgi:ABC-type protease/lipase transport system fused ATPase/permease subunit
VAADPARTELPDPVGRLDVNELTSVIPGTRTTVLRNVSFSVEPGELLAIVLVRHLVGVWSPLAGSIRLDGADLKNWNNADLGRHLGYLPQEVKLFGGTVAQNISRFQENVADVDIVRAARLAGAHDLIQLFAEGYDTQVGDGGSQLSGGQRQRVGLARAVYGLPSLIILDEPNSNLDGAGEEALATCLRELKLLKRTVVVVTHKANLLSLADKTLILSSGQVQKFGPTHEVFRKSDAQTAEANHQHGDMKRNA